MPTLGYLVDERAELELRFVGGVTATGPDAKVATLVTISQERLLAGDVDLAHPPGTLILLTLSAGGIEGATAEAVDRTLRTLAKFGAAGLVVTTPEQDLSAYPPTTCTIASRLRIPLLTTTAHPSTWDSLNEGIQYCRAQYAERQLDDLAGLLRSLPAQLADATAMRRITEWLAAALDALVRVSDRDRGVLAAAPDHATSGVTRQSVGGPRPIPPLGAGSHGHTRIVSLAPTRKDAPVLAVAADRPFDEADGLLIQHAAKLMGLVDQAHTEYEGVAQSAREARAASYQLLMNGEPAKALRVMAGLAPGLSSADQSRVFVIDCGAASLRDVSVRRVAAAAVGRALVVRCPTNERHIVVVEPLHHTAAADAGIAGDLQRLVLSLGGPHRMAGSSRRPIARVPSAHEEAVAALSDTELTKDPVVLSADRANLVDVLEPAAARAWAIHVLAPIGGLLPAHAEEMERTLRVALARSNAAEAARRLHVHRNTVAMRLARAAELLGLDLGSVRSKVIVGLALDIKAAIPAAVASDGASGCTLSSFLAGPRVRAWAESVLDLLAVDRRDLKRTLQAWLDHDARVDEAARALGLSEATVRNHLKTAEQVTGRDLTTLAGIRDISIALSICTGTPALISACPAVA
ncbi:helix-turn-helix domain-containing protein [Streptomyces sp. NPDC020681]|uniref:helix-turn-helix domain-containing protein n=1 Tax=Streptomyces sp. NPDC020681 TaxID=3365083 RepID=UPI0037B2473F